jgi:hypothetical protein
LDHTITIRGPRQDVAGFIRYVESATSAELKTEYSTPVADALSRKPFGQFDIIQAIVTFATSASAPIVTAEIQRIIKDWREKHKKSSLEIEQAPSTGPSAAEAPPDE